MAFKNQPWKNYKKKRGIVEFILRDETGAKTGSFKATNQKDYSRILKIIVHKCGYESEDNNEVEEGVNWLKKDYEW